MKREELEKKKEELEKAIDEIYNATDEPSVEAYKKWDDLTEELYEIEDQLEELDKC